MTELTPQAFAEYMARNYPDATVISDIGWHIPKIWRAAVHAMRTSQQPRDWTHDYDTESRGAKWVLYEGSPGENGMKFCPACGKPLNVVPRTEEEAL